MAIPELDILRGDQLTPGEWGSHLQRLWPQIKDSLAKATEKYKQYADRKQADHKQLRVGDLVYLSTKYIKLHIPSHKLGPQYLRPFLILKMINPMTLVLKLPPLLGKIHPVFHISLLKPVTNPPKPTSQTGPVKGNQYEVEGILDSRCRRGKLQYLVKWKGYPFEDASWVGVTDLHADRLVKQFHSRHPNKPGGGRPGGTVGMHVA